MMKSSSLLAFLIISTLMFLPTCQKHTPINPDINDPNTAVKQKNTEDLPTQAASEALEKEPAPTAEISPIAPPTDSEEVQAPAVLDEVEATFLQPENSPQSEILQERKPPENCSYQSYYWSVKERRSVGHYTINKPYHEVNDEEKSPDDPRCTVCEEDQILIVPRTLGIELDAFKVCHVYAKDMTLALRKISESGTFDLQSITGYRVGKTRGKVVDNLRTEWSNHSFGTAVDINAKRNGLYNQCNVSVNNHSSDIASCKLGMGGEWVPEKYPRTSITAQGIVVQSLHFWKWGGAIPGALKDIMHFSITGY